MFRIVFTPLETRAGSTHLINETRHGSYGGGIEVYDARTGNRLKFEYLPGAEMMARKIPGNLIPEDHEGTPHGPRNTILLPAKWEVSALSQPADFASYRGRSFLAPVNIHNEDSLQISIRGQRKE